MATFPHTRDLIEQVSPAVEFSQELMTVWATVVHLQDRMLSWLADATHGRARSARRRNKRVVNLAA